MEISSVLWGFIASYLAGSLPSLREIISKKDKTTLDERIEQCYHTALERWCANDAVRQHEQVFLSARAAHQQRQRAQAKQDFFHPFLILTYTQAGAGTLRRSLKNDKSVPILYHGFRGINTNSHKIYQR